MEYQAHPYRSVLYMPGSNARALEKAKTLAADALILDLEDAVAMAEKPLAREMVCKAVATGGFGRRKILVRTNGLDTEWCRDDFQAVCAVQADGVLVPKVNNAADVHRSLALMEEFGARADTQLWAMMETPLAMLNAAEIAAASPRLEGLVLGTNDLVKDLGARHTADRLPVVTGLGLCLLAARAHGLICVDGVFNAFRDDQGLQAACQQGRDMGFDGKTLIHPAQLAIANEVFAPSAEDLDEAQVVVRAFAEAEAKGEGVAVVDGRIVENLHVEMGQRLIARAKTIAELGQAVSLTNG